jgi:manganese/zinc/iron transport system substrate-binding protein
MLRSLRRAGNRSSTVIIGKSVVRIKFLFAVLLSAVLLAAGCGKSDKQSEVSPALGEKDILVATTGHIADALRRLTDNHEIVQLCGPGVDPHSYSASTKDVQVISDAKAVFFNGFHLEARLHDILEDKFADKCWAMASAFPPEARLDWVEDGQVDPEAPFDPHIWNHLPGWGECVKGMTAQLCELDPDNVAEYQTRGDVYVDEIMTAHEAAVEKFSTLSEKQRVLVSAHDVEAIAVLGVGNDAEADVKTIRDVAVTVCDKKVPAIFLENITNPKVTAALQEACQAKGWEVRIAEEPLYSDDLGVDPPLDTFLGTFNHNVDLITESLSKKIAD